MGYCIENNIIESVDVNIIAHFGNCNCFEIRCSNVWPMNAYNNTQNLGYLIVLLLNYLRFQKRMEKYISKYSWEQIFYIFRKK